MAIEIGGLVLHLEAGRTHYRAGEPLELSAGIENRSEAAIVVMARASHVDLALMACDAEGNPLTTLLPPAPPMPPRREDLVTLAPGERVALAPWELLERVNAQILRGRGRPGRFTVEARYFAGVGLTECLWRLDPAAWTGRLDSDTLLLTVEA